VRGEGLDWPAPNPSRKREGDFIQSGATSPLPLAGGAGGGPVSNPMPAPEWKPRNTERARALRNAATPAERLLWRHLARSQLGAKFSRQMQVGPFFADFLCREQKLVVELDGFSHDLTPERDAARDRWFAAQGYRVLRFTNADVLGNAEGVATAIRMELERLGVD
jgi:very-short-patch-repair endonuclease